MLSHSHYLGNLLKDEYHLVWIITLNHATYTCSLKRAFVCVNISFFNGFFVVHTSWHVTMTFWENHQKTHQGIMTIWYGKKKLQGLYVNVKREGIHRKTTHTYTWPRILTKCKIATPTTILACIHVRRRIIFACEKFHLTTQTSKKREKGFQIEFLLQIFSVFLHMRSRKSCILWYCKIKVGR